MGINNPTLQNFTYSFITVIITNVNNTEITVAIIIMIIIIITIIIIIIKTTLCNLERSSAVNHLSIVNERQNYCTFPK